MITMNLFVVLLAAVAAGLYTSARARSAVQQASRHPFFRPAVALVALGVLALWHPQALLALPVAIGALVEGQHTGEFILSETGDTISRDQVTLTVAAATTLAPGMVLGKLTATGKYVPYDNAGGSGSDVAYGILYGEVVNAGVAPADFQAVVINWGAEVRKGDLKWGAGLVDVDKTAAYADLAARGVKARD